MQPRSAMRMRSSQLKTLAIRLFMLALASVILFSYYVARDPNPPEEYNERVHNWMNDSRYIISSASVCHTPLCIATYESGSSRSSNNVPFIRHILWKSHRVSGYFARQLKAWHDIHPNWTYVLWRDSDIDQFISKHYAGAHAKFQSLPERIIRIDMVRYFILHHFGGVYADLDYVLVRPLDRFLKFPAVVTRETEAHSLFWYGMDLWPPRILGNPAFMMSKPGHIFFSFCTQQLLARPDNDVLLFAGRLGLSDMLVQFGHVFPSRGYPDSAVIVPPSRSFYGFPDNSLASSTSQYKATILQSLRALCSQVKYPRHRPATITAYCKDVLHLDPITDPNATVYAIHDSNKSKLSYDDPQSLSEFTRTRWIFVASCQAL